MATDLMQPRQAAVIPVRRTEAGVQVCLIKRRTSAKWGIPKGFIEQGDSARAALDEATEEAGLGGRLIGDSIGLYSYDKGPRTLTVVVYLMEVLEEHAVWREMRWRERRWYAIEEAAALLESHGVWPVFRHIQPRLYGDALRPER